MCKWLVYICDIVEDKRIKDRTAKGVESTD